MKLTLDILRQNLKMIRKLFSSDPHTKISTMSENVLRDTDVEVGLFLYHWGNAISPEPYDGLGPVLCQFL